MVINKIGYKYGMLKINFCIAARLCAKIVFYSSTVLVAVVTSTSIVVRSIVA